MTWANDDEDSAGPAYSNVYLWVREWLAPHYRRSFETSSRVWCPRWSEHPEALSRLIGLWQAYEELVPKDRGTGLAHFWLHYIDPTMAVLLDRDRGPFGVCKNGHSDRLEPLPTSDDAAHALEST